MRALPLLLVGLLAMPAALAGHPVPYDPAALASEGAEIVVFVDVAGRYSGSAQRNERVSDSLYEYSTTWAASYAWSATAFLEAMPQPDAQGWTHAGRAWANVTLSWDDRGSGKSTHSIGEEYEWSTTAEHTCVGHGLNKMYPNVLARVEGQHVLVRFPDMQWNGANTVRFDCRASDTSSRGEVTEQPRVGPAAIVQAPLIDRAASRENMSHLDLELEPLAGRQSFVGTYSGGGGAPRARDAAYAYCGEEDEHTTRSCTAFGTVEATIWVDPCKLVKESFDKHLADVQALKRPPNGSSESQVRAFQVDVGQKVRPLLADARTLELMCGGAPPDAMLAASAASRMVADAWADVVKRGGASQDGLRDAVAAERAAELMGAGGSGDSVLPAVVAQSARLASVKVHSPVALHAWDEDGRHVGWNATSGAAESGIPGATYEGEPGGAQTLLLPEGVYTVAADELGPGTYALNLSTNETSDVTALRSAAGGASTFVVLVDHLGVTTLAAARGAQEPGFVAPTELHSTAPPPGASGTSGATSGDGADAKGAPLAAWVPVAAIATAVALLARRRRE